jgi:SH3 domain protein
MKIKKDLMKQFLIKNTFIAILTIASTASLNAETTRDLNQSTHKNELKHGPNTSQVLPHRHISVFEKNKVLVEKITLLESENDVLKGINSRLSKSQRNTWFLYGALAVLLGAGLTITIPSLASSKRTNDEWR